MARRRLVILSLAIATAASAVAIGCGGDDVDTQSGDDDAASDAGLTIDTSIVVNVDSGKRDSGSVTPTDASDDAALCSDGAPGTMCPSDGGVDAD